MTEEEIFIIISCRFRGRAPTRELAEYIQEVERSSVDVTSMSDMLRYVSLLGKTLSRVRVIISGSSRIVEEDGNFISECCPHKDCHIRNVHDS